jgi:hypothetical protein
VILENGATLKNTSKWTDRATLNSFFRGKSVFDIVDGKFLPASSICTAQTADSDTTINLHGTSVVDTGTKGLRLGNNGKVTINIYDSASFFKRNNANEMFTERGQTILNLHGGKLICGNDRLGGGVLQLNYSASSFTTEFPSSELNLAGGELYMTQFKNDTVAGTLLSRPIYVYLDGSTWRCTATGNAFLFGSACNASTFSRVSSRMVGRVRSMFSSRPLSSAGALAAMSVTSARKRLRFFSGMVKPAASACPPKVSSRGAHCSSASKRLKPPLERQEPLPRPFSRQIINTGSW